MSRISRLFFLLSIFLSIPVSAQRRPVLPQIDEPHSYYYRELYLPQWTSTPTSLSWSPESDELVYSMAGSLWRQRLDSEEAVQLTDGPGYDYQPDWSPDGKSVVYASYQKDAVELWLLDLATGKSRQITNAGAVNVEPRWSPDGTKIVWVSTQYNRRFHIFMGDLRSGTLQNVVRLTGEAKSPLPRYYYSAYDMEINPVWARDGKEIVFVSNRGHIHGTGGFWRMKAEEGAEAHEFHYEETNWKARPDFSPDGSRMIYSSYLGRQWNNLWLMPAKGGDAFPITYGDWDETNPRWSPDGARIAAISNQPGTTEIFTQSILSGERSVLKTGSRRYLLPHANLTLKLNQKAGFTAYRRISITDEKGRFYAPEDAWVSADDGFDRSLQSFEAHYFYSDGERDPEISVPRGKIHIQVSHGFLEKPFDQIMDLSNDAERDVSVQLQPLEFTSEKEGAWVSSDLHVHMNYGGTYRNYSSHLWTQAEAEGLDMVQELVVNKEQRFPDISFTEPLRMQPEDADIQIIRGQEFHTSYWGHRGILRLKDHLLLPGYAGYPNTAAASLFPMNADVYDMAHAQGALVGAVHPFDEVPDPFAKPAQKITDELPVDVALGKLDYLEVVGFSDHKSTSEVWYKLLNLGFHLPAGGGTDATTNFAAPIRGQVGFDRVYVWTPAWPPDIDTWLAQLKQGRSFATNGPLLEFTLGGEMVGSELKFGFPQQTIPFTAKLRSIVPVDHLEVVCNGKVVQNLRLEGTRDTADLTGTIPLTESGWCLLRAWSERAQYPVMDNYTFATTSPVYVSVEEKRAYNRKDAEYFLAWIDRSIEVTSQHTDWNSPSEKEHVLRTLQEARSVFQRMN